MVSEAIVRMIAYVSSLTSRRKSLRFGLSSTLPPMLSDSVFIGREVYGVNNVEQLEMMAQQVMGGQCKYTSCDRL